MFTSKRHCGIVPETRLAENPLLGFSANLNNLGINDAKMTVNVALAQETALMEEVELLKDTAPDAAIYQLIGFLNRRQTPGYIASAHDYDEITDIVHKLSISNEPLIKNLREKLVQIFALTNLEHSKLTRRSSLLYMKT